MTNNLAWTGPTKADDGWSEWIDWEGGECPVMPETAVQWKGRRVNKNGIDGSIGAEMLYWEHLGQDMDITAYRYRLDDNAMTPEEEEMPAEEWRAEKPDNVNKPKHYQLREGYEVYDLRQDLASKASAGGATYDQYSDWDRAIEYIIRMWGKNRLEDAKKGRWYLDKLISKMEAE